VVSDELLKGIVVGALALHGLAHGIAFAAILLQLVQASGKRILFRTWLFRSQTYRQAAVVAAPFWLISTIAFVAAAAALQGLVFIGMAWRTFAIVGAWASLLGMGLFPGQWPGAATRARSLFNTGIAVFMDLVVLLSLLVVGWPPIELLKV
jgi:hypothetical protein